MQICTVIKDTAQSLQTERNKYVFKRDLDDYSDGAHLTSFGIELQTEKEAKENERSPSVALLCAGLLRRGMVYELERVLRVSDGFLCSMSVIYDGAVLLWQWYHKLAILYVLPTLTGIQWSDFKCVVILDDFGRSKFTRAA